MLRLAKALVRVTRGEIFPPPPPLEHQVLTVQTAPKLQRIPTERIPRERVPRERVPRLKMETQHRVEADADAAEHAAKHAAEHAAIRAEELTVVVAAIIKENRCLIKGGENLPLLDMLAPLCCVDAERNASLVPKRVSPFVPKERVEEIVKELKQLTLELDNGENAAAAIKARANMLLITAKEERVASG